MPERRCYGYAAPWDLDGDPAAADRAAALGVDAVAVAASYHAARAARPLHPAQPLVDVRHAACYVPLRRAAWAGRRLVPLAPGWVSSDDSFGDAQRALTAVGVGVHAWVVLTHNSALGRAHPDLVVRNAFGAHYSHALCPSAPEVVEYCATLVDEVVQAAQVEGIVLEAAGPMGFAHNGPHEKTDLAGWDAVHRALLSLCFCAACSTRCAAAGLDVADVRARVRRAVGEEPGSVEQALGEDTARALRSVRHAAVAELQTRLIEAARRRQPGLRVTLHADPDPWATGSFAPVVDRALGGVDSLVAQCFDAAAGAQAVRALSEHRHTATGAFVRPGGDWDGARSIRARLDDHVAAGADELHLYHLGMVGHRGRQLLRQMVETFRGTS